MEPGALLRYSFGHLRPAFFPQRIHGDTTSPGVTTFAYATLVAPLLAKERDNPDLIIVRLRSQKDAEHWLNGPLVDASH